MPDIHAAVARPDLPDNQAIVVRDGAPASILAAIVTLARDPAVDVTKLDALLKMQERMEGRQAEVAFTRALADLPPIRVKKNGKVTLLRKDGTDGGTYPFAKWEDIDLIIGPLLHEKGFRLTFDSAPRQGDGGGLVVTGTLLHCDGHSRSASMPLALDTGPGRNNLQAMGSTLSYGKRYCAEMLLNIVREGDDDDGLRGGARYITAEQVKELSDLLNETKTPLDRFCATVGVEAIPDIQEPAFALARNLLDQKRQRQAAKK